MRLHTFARRWWRGEAGAVGTALDVVTLPLELAFRAGVAAKNRAFDRNALPVESVDVPVISVGNIAVGGAGKTPFAAWAAAQLAAWGRRPGIAIRGYGGDEVVLHRELNPGIPVAAAAKRIEAARELAAGGCDVVVLDDGFQHRRLARDLDVVLVAAETWTLRPRLLPRGPWREGLGALARADVLVVTRKAASPSRAMDVAAALTFAARGRPAAIAHLAADGVAPLHGGAAAPLGSLAGRAVLAVAGLAEPEPFFAAVREAGAEVEPAAYPDHHPFSADDARELQARAAGRPIVMTHKDAVKLRGLLPLSVEALVLEQAVRIEAGEDALDAALRAALEAASR